MIRALRSQAALFGALVIVPVVAVFLLLPGMAANLFSSEQFMPHVHCYLNEARVVWLHVTSDFLIGLAYFLISAMLAFLVIKARSDIPFQWMFLAFGVFIISCGGTHFMEVWTMWNPTYWLSGSVKLITATASIATAIALPPLLPKVFTLIETAKASEERKRQLEVAHREMELMNRRLRELDELKSRFFANVSHELRTPLTLILGPAGQLLRSALAPEQRAGAELIQRNATVLLKQVTDLLDASRLEAGRMAVDYAQADFAELTRLVAGNFQGIAEERRIDFTVAAPSTLPGEVDPEKWERILMNLLSNAFKFAPEGGRVQVGLEVRDQRVRLSVSDNGPGVPVESRQIIFERFRQADSTDTRKHGGTGLGLSIAREFVQLLGGEIQVEDAPGGGALFVVNVPLRAPEAAAIRPEPGEPSRTMAQAVAAELRAGVVHSQAVTGFSGARPVVLLAEDNADMQKFLVQSLDEEFETIPAADGQEALEKARAKAPDLILTDMMMPRMSGEGLIAALRQDRRFDSVPIVLLTARAEDALRVRLLRLGAQDYLTKPFSIEELHTRVRNLIEARRTRRELERANEELEAFSYSVAHDLRAPVRAMQSYAEIVLQEAAGRLSADDVNHLNRILTAGQRLDTLIQDVLSYSRVARAPIGIEAVNVEKLIDEIMADNPLFRPPRAEIEVARPIPLVLGNDASLIQVIGNLLTNGVKFVETGVTPRLRIWSETSGDRVKILFEDNGIGIAPEYQSRIWGMFERVDGRAGFEGTGIGLAIVRKAAERMRGSAGVKSEPGRGSQFWIELPAAPQA